MIEPADDMHFLSLLVRDRVSSALRTNEGVNLARQTRGVVALAAGGMETHLVFDGHTIRLDQNRSTGAQARAAGTLASFLAICHGKVRFADILRRQIRVSGHLLLLRRVLSLLSMGMPDEHD